MHHDQVFRDIGLSDLPRVAEEVVKRMGDYKVWLFYGGMGAGKTTLIKTIGARLGVPEIINSPTFSIVNEYETDDRSSIYHFDFYRLKDEVEAYDIGADEYFYSGNPCLIEWPEKIPSLIPSRHGKVKLDIENDTHRTIVISVHDGEEENRI